MITETFEFISSLKHITKCDLVITDDEKFIMKAFHRKLKRIISYKLWEKIVVNYSIDTLSDIYDSCDRLIDEIYKKYK